MTRSQLLRQAAGALIVLTVLARWAHGEYTGDPVGPMWELAVLGAFFVGLIALFGWDTVKRGTDTAKDVANSEDQESE